MKRTELIGLLAERFPQLSRQDADLAVKEILDGIKQALVEGHRVEVRGFGTFEVNFRGPRIGRNPKTGELVPVGEKHVPHFKAGKDLRERVDAVFGN